MTVADLWFIRHFRTPWNSAGRMQGRRDIALDDPLGPEDRASLARNLAALHGRSFSAVWSSPLERTRRTAELHGFVAPELLPDLLEIDFGPLEGRFWSDLSQDQLSFWRHAPDRLDLGEPFAVFVARVARVLESVRSLDGPPVLIFGHGAWAGCLRCLNENRPSIQMNRDRLPNGALMILRVAETPVSTPPRHLSGNLQRRP